MMSHATPSPKRLGPLSLRRWALLAVILLATFLRFYQIADLPPGDGYDPAYYGVDALDILQGQFPIFLPTNIGREVMFSYLTALCVLIFGIGPQAIHSAAAVVGLLTVPATYRAATELFAAEPGALRRYGPLLTAFLLAISFWHLNWSRYGVRAILVPLWAALTLTFLWRALRHEKRRDFIAAGVCLGLSLYTYQSARTLPLLGGLAFVYWRGMPWRFTRRDWQNLALVGTIAMLIFAPLGFYFLTHRGSASERIEQTLLLDPALGLAANVQRVWNEGTDALRVLSLTGDEEHIHNLTGRPALNPFLSVCFYLGLLLCIPRIRQPNTRMMLGWLFWLSVTVFLTIGGQPTKRALGALPALLMLAALGWLLPIEALWRWAARRSLSRVLAGGVTALALAGLVYSGNATFRDYFLVWGRDPNLFIHFEGPRMAMGQYIASLPANELIYLSPELPGHPSIVYNSGGRAGIRGYNGRVCLVLPEQAERHTSYIIGAEDEGSLAALQRFYPQGAEVAAGPEHYGRPVFRVYGIPRGARAALTPMYPLTTHWDGQIAVLGYDLNATLYHPGDTLVLTLYYRALRRMDANYVVFTHLWGPPNPQSGTGLWGQDDSEPCRTFYPTSWWMPDELVRDHFSIVIPAETPPGEFELRMGFYTWPEMTHLFTEADATTPATESGTLGRVTIAARE